MQSINKLPLGELPEMLTVQQTAEYIGVSRNTVYTLCQQSKEQGGLSSFKVGNTRRIRKTVLIDWIGAHEQAQSG